MNQERKRQNQHKYMKTEKGKATKRRNWHKHKERVNLQRRETYKSNPLVKKRLNLSSKRYNQRMKEVVINHYSNGTNKCSCCGESIMAFLTIDHIHGNGKQHRKELGPKGIGAAFYRWLIDNGFPEGYQIQCYNCNCGRRFFKTCPHKM